MERVSASELHDLLTAIDPVQLTAEIIADKPEMITAFVQKQLHEGEDKFGNSLPPYKNKAYAKKKNRQNPAPGLGTPDYYQTGALYNGMTVAVNADGFENISKADHFQYIKKRGIKGNADGSLAFDLNADNLDTYREEVLYEELKQKYAERTGLTIKG